jgi:ribosomal protein L11 methyltransferase
LAEPARRTWPALDLDVRPSATLPADFEDRLALALDDAAPVAVESDGSTHWRVYFDTDQARAEGAATLRAALGRWLDQATVDVEDEGWAVKVQRDLGPISAGRFVIAPPWDVPATGAGEVIIVIEPSVGFGTGHHQSTRLCLRAIERVPLSGRRVADVGTGSGVLAIAAAKLGARVVVALDNDGDAVGAARANISRNDVAPIVAAEVTDVAACSGEPFDLVIANLTVHLLRRYARSLASLVAPGGTLVTSGFTADQVPLVLDAFPAFTQLARDDEDDWVALTMRKA